VYTEAEKVVETTNARVQAAQDIIGGLHRDGVLGAEPFTKPIDFVYFDLWHYDGRTSKHGAFMGGADFVQWHGNYPMLAKTVELKAQAEELRRRHGRP
jgi:hydroxylamine dehydrogenase